MSISDVVAPGTHARCYVMEDSDENHGIGEAGGDTGGLVWIAIDSYSDVLFRRFGRDFGQRYSSGKRNEDGCHCKQAPGICLDVVQFEICMMSRQVSSARALETRSSDEHHWPSGCSLQVVGTLK